MTSFDDALRETLSSARYDRLTGRAVDIKQIITEAVKRFIELVLDKINIRLPIPDTGNINIYVNILIAVGVLVLLVVVGIAVRFLLKKRGTSAAVDLSDIFEELAQKQYTLEELLAINNRYAAAGELREAVRYRYIAVLVALNNRQLIRIGISKTNAQLIAELSAAAPELTAPFSKMVDIFHYTWFGRKPVQSQTYTRFIEISDTLIRQDGGGE